MLLSSILLPQAIRFRTWPVPLSVSLVAKVYGMAVPLSVFFWILLNKKLAVLLENEIVI